MTIGVFDGLHTGHMALLDKLSTKGDKKQRFLFTFTPNPKRILGIGEYQKDIMTLRQKTLLITNSHIDNMVLIDFSSEFSKLRGEEFFSMIQTSCDLRYIVIGENFSCGYQSLFGANKIKDWFAGSGTDVEIVPSVMKSHERICSSRIRRAILSGDIKTANKLIGRSLSIDLVSVPHDLGKRTFVIRIDYIMQILPPPGSYNVTYHLKNGSSCHGEIVIHHDIITCVSDDDIDSQLIEIKINEQIGDEDGIN